MSRRAKKHLKKALETMAKRLGEIPLELRNNRHLIKNLWLDMSLRLQIVKHRKSKKKRYNIKDFNFSDTLTIKDALTAFEQIKDYLYIFKLRDNDIQGQDIIRCKNVEIRRFLIQEYGAKKLFSELNAHIIHRDGSSRLLSLNMNGGGVIMMVEVTDSTTNEKYLLRVPPFMSNCKQAIAWTFGMSADEYDPLQEA